MRILEHPLEPFGSRSPADPTYTDGVLPKIFSPGPVLSYPSKKEIRRLVRARRKALSPEQQHRAGLRLGERLQRLNLFAPGRRIAFYFAADGEISLDPAIARAKDCGSRCLVPIVPLPGQRRLHFAPVDAPLAPNRFRIPEPQVSPREYLCANQLDLILVPLVAFDDRGNRLGMGGGFYDTTLSQRHQNRNFQRPRIIGIAHECQRLESIEVEPWDIPMTCIVTDHRVYAFGANAGNSHSVSRPSS